MRSVPLAYGTGLIMAILISMLFPMVLPDSCFVGARGKLTKVLTWFFSAVTGVLTGGARSSLIGKLGRASARNVDVTAPSWMRGSIDFLEMTFPKTRLLIILITVISVLTVSFFLNNSSWGIRIRAVTQNRSISDCLGISTETVDVLTFGIGSGPVSYTHLTLPTKA